MEELTQDVWRWREHSDRLGYDLNGWYWTDGAEAVAVDPPALTKASRARMEETGKPSLIVVTNRTHWRRTDDLAAWSGARVAMSAVDAEAVEGEVHRVLAEGDELAGGWRVVEAPGKTLGEIALYRAAGDGALIVGDSLIGDPPGRLRLLPPEKIDDRTQLLLSLGRLAALRFDALLVGDGEPVVGGADRAVRDFVRGLT